MNGLEANPVDGPRERTVAARDRVLGVSCLEVGNTWSLRTGTDEPNTTDAG